MKIKYTSPKRQRNKTLTVYAACIAMGITLGFGISTFAASDTEIKPVTIEPVPIVAHDVVECSVEEPEVLVPVSDVLTQMNAGIAAAFTPGTEENDAIIEYSNSIKYVEGFEEPKYIRCTGYCDYGYTKSGEYVREGIVAGKKEWLGNTCLVYEVAEDGSCGKYIGSYDFLDTGYGIKTKTSKGVEGSLRLGKSIDIWFPTEDAIWDWMSTYGDYVYIKIIDNN